MDIPETGAIFSLGKSHLAENNQSYFFVKNDPVKRLVSGSNQAAVICESGRLFVWGENQFGQLATGGGSSGTEIVTKPTCVKSLKTLGLQVVDISFGLGWSAIITNSNEIYFSGRNIFPEATKVFQKFSRVDVEKENVHITRKAIVLDEFSDLIKDEPFQRILAGNDHFAVLTESGRLFAWGSNASNQLGQPDPSVLLPVEIKVDSLIRSFVCGPKSTLILTETNQLFMSGALNDFKFSQPMEMNLNFPKEEIIFMQISHANEIYLVTESGSIYKSSETARNNNLIFNKFYDYNHDENGIVVKLLKGSSFFTALTKTNKLFTTFSESGHHLKTFREISKFKNLKILDFAIGDRLVLVLGMPKASRSLESSSRSLNSANAVTPARTLNLMNGLSSGLNKNFDENDELNEDEGFRDLSRIKQDQPSDNSMGDLVDDTYMSRIQDVNENSINENIVKEAKDRIESFVNEEKKNMLNGYYDDSNDEIKNDAVPDSKPTEEIRVLQRELEKNLNSTDDPEPKSTENGTERTPAENSSAEIEDQVPQIITNTDSSKLITLTPALKRSLRARNGSGRSIKFEESALKQNKSTDRMNRPQTPYPDPNSTSPLIRKDSNLSYEDIDLEHSPVDSLEHIPEDSPQTIDTVRRVSLKYSDRGLSNEKLNEITRIISAKTPGERIERFVLIDDVLENDEELKIEIETTSIEGSNNEIRYINNGVDVTENVQGSHEIQSLNEKTPERHIELKRPVKLPEQNGWEKSPRENSIGKFENVRSERSTTDINDDKKVKDLKQTTQEDIMSLNEEDDLNKTDSSSKEDGKLKTSPGEDDERTTASVNSNIITNNFDIDSTPTSDKDRDSLDDIETIDPETKKDRVRRFLKDLKNKGKEMSCKNEESILVEDEPPKYTATAADVNADGKTSKVCIIL